MTDPTHKSSPPDLNYAGRNAFDEPPILSNPLSVASRLLVIIGFNFIVVIAGHGVAPAFIIIYWTVQDFWSPDKLFAWRLPGALSIGAIALLLISMLLRGYLRFGMTMLGLVFLFGVGLYFFGVSDVRWRHVTLFTAIPFLVFFLLALAVAGREMVHWSSEKIRYEARMAAMNSQHPDQ